MKIRKIHRREGRRRAIGGLAAVGLVVGLPFVLRGLTIWLRQDNPRGIPILVVGVVIIGACLAGLKWVGSTWQRAVTADAEEARALGVPALPFGAEPLDGGVVLRPRAAIRVTPGLLVVLMLLTGWGMSEDGLPIQGGVVLVGAAAMAALWWWTRTYELCLDHSGMWRRRRPRWRLAWSDLGRVENKSMSTMWYPNKPDDLIVHGRITTPRGLVKESVRVRCNLLAIMPSDFRALAQQYADGTPVAPPGRHEKAPRVR
ncbi:hypothetical protein [Phycicoccus sp. Soil748]|uniref:hypothetical protein n=1 Tax=Phycicoccus sp. Soil748 TaxID=1736397 RepID=UPI000A715F28|nr:hypothetical protein [Phycicoccus sp. Soil748]